MSHRFSKTRTTDAAPALRQALVRATLTICGLALFWQLGMQDLHSLTKAAAFTLIANAGLAGVQLLLHQRRVVALGALVLNSLVLLNATVEGFLFWLYGLAPKNIVVADAILGSNANEVREFIESYSVHLGLVVLLALGLMALLAWVERRFNAIATDAPPGNRRDRVIGTTMLALFAALHINDTMAQENPLVYWPAYYADYRSQRDTLADVRHQVAGALVKAQGYKTAYVGPARQTLVLVLGESVNRSNWSLYGYPRNTTPQLDLRRDQMLVFPNVLSSDAATAASLLKMLTPATRDQPEAWRTEPNVLALARNAGYHVTWLSNQEQGDGPIQILAEHAHEQIFVNNGHGRAASSLDEQMLPHLERVLAGPAPRKLIVVHMLGAHLRYELRYPAAYGVFTGAKDSVTDGMVTAGRPFWVRKARNQYDNAMRYTDHVLDTIIQKASDTPAAGAMAVLYVSDHGQEVGHYSNFYGHSTKHPSGYQVPLLLWTNDKAPLPAAARTALQDRGYRTDYLDHTLLGLLHIQSCFYRPDHDVLSNRFVRPGPPAGALLASATAPCKLPAT